VIRPKASTFAVLCTLLLSPVALHAQTEQPREDDTQRWSLHWGTGFEQQRIGVHWESPPTWTSTWLGRSVDLSHEIGVAQWSYTGPNHPGQTRSLTQASAIPIFRWWVGESVFLEGGIGATWVSNTALGPRKLSTHFQFGDHVGVGYRMGPSSLLGWRHSHYSNASIKRPNQGLDIFQITLSSAF
jgi:lipid A 3-O-deacylase